MSGLPLPRDGAEPTAPPRAITVVVTTYNQPRWLRLVLSGFSAQTDREFQLVVADDGSGSETAQVVRDFETRVGTELLHVRHEDLGFRKTVILNRAIRASGGDYLIFTDGDCIPRRDFVAVHRRLAQVGRFLSGMAIRLPAEVSRRIRPDDVTSGRAFRLRWLRSQGARPGRRGWKLLPLAGLGTFLDLTSGVTPRFDGGNASAWRRDLESANGFDNRMGYGLEDQSLGWRLTNMGVRGKQVRNRAICLHLDHERPYRDPGAMRRHAEVRDRILRDGLVRAPSGLLELDQIPEPDGPSGPTQDGSSESRPDGSSEPRPDGSPGPSPDGPSGPGPSPGFRRGRGGLGVVLATYEQPRYLSLVLEAYARQDRRPDEIVVADDGSGPETARVVEESAVRLGLPVVHLWQPDRGFRKTLILNRAVQVASADYLIFSDGDCLPRRDFVGVHADLARRGHFLAGSAVRLSPALSRRLGVEDVRTGRFASLRWLLGQGERPGRRVLRFAPRPLGAMLDLLSPTRATWSGGNASVAREEIVKVNGFDLDLGYGGEDRIFGERLRNAGVRGVRIRSRALVLHLDHDRPYRNQEQVLRQRALRRSLQGRGVMRASQGLEETGDDEIRIRRWPAGPR